MKDPKLLLKKLRQEKEHVNELMAQGEVEKAEEIKNNIAWQKAFDKTEGKKVNDRLRASEVMTSLFFDSKN